MREGIIIEIAPVITLMQIGSLKADWHAATAGTELIRLAPSSVLYNL